MSRTRPTTVTCGFDPPPGSAPSPGGAPTDVPDRVPAAGLDGATRPLRRGQGHRDPRAAPPTRRTEPPHPATPDELGGPSIDRRLCPTTPPPSSRWPSR